MFSSVIGKLKEAGRWIGQNPKSSLIGAAIAVTGGAALAYGMGAFAGAAGAAGTAAVAEAATVAPAVVPAALPYTNELLNRFARNPGALGMNFRPGGYN